MLRRRSAKSPQTRLRAEYLLAEGLINSSERSRCSPDSVRASPRAATAQCLRNPRATAARRRRRGRRRARARAPALLPLRGRRLRRGRWFEPCRRGLRARRGGPVRGRALLLRAAAEPPLADARSGARAALRRAALRQRRAAPSVKGASCNGTHFQRLFDATAAAVAATAQYQRTSAPTTSSSRTAGARRCERSRRRGQGAAVDGVLPHTFRNAIVGHMEVVHKQDDGWWRCSVVSPYVANFDEAARAHEASPTASRKTNFYFHGGANNRGTYGYAFRQAALAQLQALPSSYLSAIELPGNPAPCRGAVTTNCRAGRSTRDFRERMASTKFNLVLRGDSPSSRRLYDGWWRARFPSSSRSDLVGRPPSSASCRGDASPSPSLRPLSPPPAPRARCVGCVAARRRARAAPALRQPPPPRRRVEHEREPRRRECAPHGRPPLPPRAAPRRRGGRQDDAPSAAAARAAARRVRARRRSCRVPDGERCPGCEVGAISPATPVEHCCADSCPSCNCSADARCLPPDVFHGDPLLDAPARRQALLAYLDATDKKAELLPPLQAWRAKVGRPGGAAAEAEGEGRGEARGSAAGIAEIDSSISTH